jgi:hypothetical protein
MSEQGKKDAANIVVGAAIGGVLIHELDQISEEQDDDLIVDNSEVEISEAPPLEDDEIVSATIADDEPMDNDAVTVETGSYMSDSSDEAPIVADTEIDGADIDAPDMIQVSGVATIADVEVEGIHGIMIDADGNGSADEIAVDYDGDGIAETSIDPNEIDIQEDVCINSVENVAEVDLYGVHGLLVDNDGDGDMDVFLSDTDGDGELDHQMDVEQNIGTITTDDLQAMMHDDDEPDYMTGDDDDFAQNDMNDEDDDNDDDLLAQNDDDTLDDDALTDFV